MNPLPNDPNGVLEFLTDLATQHLNTRPSLFPGEVAGTTSPLPQVILKGSQGAGRPYSCACGIMKVENLGRGKPLYVPGQSLTSVMVNSDPCNLVWTNAYQILIERCAPPFDNRLANGAPPDVDERNALAMSVSEESWELLIGIRKLLKAHGALGRSSVGEWTNNIYNGCAKWSIIITWTHIPPGCDC